MNGVSLQFCRRNLKCGEILSNMHAEHKIFGNSFDALAKRKVNLACEKGIP